MVIRRFIHPWIKTFLPLVLLAIMTGISFSATFNLTADVTTKTMPDGAIIPMWGFSLVSYDIGSGPVSVNGPVQIPGPELTIPPGQDLVINLTNNLPVPVSIVIPGQRTTMTPVWDDGTSGTRPSLTARVRSFTHEAQANGGTATYTWSNLKPGTYLYQSGTHPAVQVQMGLYGVLTKDAAAGPPKEVYVGKQYDNQIVLLYSAIDPNIHHSVATGHYAGIPAQTIPGYTPPPIVKSFTSTIDYWPRYFLINGESYPNVLSDPDHPIVTGERLLIRFLNAGLQTYVPTLFGGYMSLIAEDGNLYPYPKAQYSVNLPAGKTIDAIFTPQSAGSYTVIERRLNLTNKGTYSGDPSSGGMVVKFKVEGGAVTPPVANNDTYSVNSGTTLNVGAPGVLINDTGTGVLTASMVAGSGPSNGSLILNANGAFSYTPNTGFAGIDSFRYRANNEGGASNEATVSITVIGNNPPSAGDNSYSVNEDNALNVRAPGVLGNDSDPEGNPLTAILVSGVSNGTLTLNANGSFTYRPNLNFFGSDSFTYKANDGSLDSNVATVSITVNSVNDAPVANNDSASTRRNTSVTINVIANDTDVDGTIAANTVRIVNKPNKGGKAVVNADGTVTYSPRRNFRGTEVFTYTVRDNGGLTSNLATVTINVR